MENFGIAPLTARYLVNHDRKEFVDKRKTPKGSDAWDGWRIHPLPLLTCEGNGNGGGDFFKRDGVQCNEELIGLWARNTIGVVSKKADIPKDYKEIIFDLRY